LSGLQSAGVGLFQDGLFQLPVKKRASVGIDERDHAVAEPPSRLIDAPLVPTSIASPGFGHRSLLVEGLFEGRSIRYKYRSSDLRRGEVDGLAGGGIGNRRLQ